MYPEGNEAAAPGGAGADRGRKVRNLILAAAKAAVSAAVLWYLLSRQDLALVGRHLAASDKSLWFGAFILLSLSQVLSSWRWQVLLRPMDFRLSWTRVLGIYFTGMFFSLFLPSMVGGDVVKTYYVARGWKKTPAAVYTLLADRGIGLAALMTFALAGAILSWERVPASLVWTVMLFVAVLYIGFFIFPYLSGPALQLFRKLREMPRERLFIYWSDPWPAVQAFLISLPVHFLLVLAHVLMARALDIPVSWGALMLVYPLTSLAGMIPASINGLGFRESTYAAVLCYFGIDKEAATSLGAMWFVILTLNGLLGLVPFLLLRHREPARSDAVP
jgi:uncharacterized membrane protein YbhN (UPF0104 family)